MKETARLLIVAGGTGGHISPGLALAEEAVARKAEVLFLSIPRNRGYAGFAGMPFTVEFYDAPAFKKDIRMLLRFPFDFFRALKQASAVIRHFQPTAVIALGGYPSLPAAAAAILAKKPLFLCEQNAVAGKVTRMLKRFAAMTFLTFGEEDASSMLTGNPVRIKLRKRAAPYLKKKRTLRAHPTVLALGGSQGAAQLNEMLMRLWVEYPELAMRLNWIVQAGASLADELQKRVDFLLQAPLRKRITVFGFDADIFRHFEKADICFSRAGAGNITEAVLFRLPMILLPYPFAADNHQRANAEVAVRSGAALLIDRKDTDPRELAEALEKLMQKSEYKKMTERAGQLAQPEAAGRILDEVILRSNP